MANDNIVLRFSDVSFEYEHGKKLLDEVSFSVRMGSRITLMGQNGAGKSSIFKMIAGELAPTGGQIFNQKDIVTAYDIACVGLRICNRGAGRG